MVNNYALSVGGVIVIFEFCSLTGFNNPLMLLRNTLCEETLCCCVAVLFQMLPCTNFLRSLVSDQLGLSHRKGFLVFGSLLHTSACFCKRVVGNRKINEEFYWEKINKKLCL